MIGGLCMMENTMASIMTMTNCTSTAAAADKVYYCMVQGLLASKSFHAVGSYHLEVGIEQ